MNIIKDDFMPAGMRAAIESVQRYQEILRPTIEAVNRYNQIVEPITRIATQITASIRPIHDVISKVDIPKMIGLSESISNYMSAVNNQVASFTSPILDWFEKIYTPPIYTLIQEVGQLSQRIIDVKKYNRVYIQEMYNARWFPYAGWVTGYSLGLEIQEILEHTRNGSKSRVQKIDKAIYNFYTPQLLKEIKKYWKTTELPNHIKKIMCQAIDAYNRKEYALTAITLSSLWQTIIFELCNDNSGHKDKQTKENFKALTQWNGQEEMIDTYFDEYIMYDCRSVDAVKDDVPGRNAFAHGWYSKYPSKKAALNAILFTDFLLDMDRLDNTEVA